MKSKTIVASLLLTTLMSLNSVASDVTQERARPIKTPPPRIEDASMKHVQARVNIQVSVDETGEVVELTISKSSDERFNQPALDAVKQWRFKPATADGKPISCKMIIPIVFNPE